MSTFVVISALATLFDRGPVDLNTASCRELEDLPCIGREKAEAIIAFREEYGSFMKLSDLLEVPGIGPSVLEEIQPLVTVGQAEGGLSDTLHWLPLVDTLATPLLTISVLDVGEGDAILLSATGGLTALVDGGPDDGGPVMPPVLARLEEAGALRLDLVLLSHPHDDHAGGLAEVVRAHPEAEVLDPGIILASPAYAALLKAVEETGAGYAYLDSGQVISLSDSVAVRVLACGGGGGESANEESAVLLVECGAFRMLLPGDVEVESERRLFGLVEPVSGMIAPHHGSRSSAFPPFLRKLRPRFVIMSAGRDNPFGHPHSSVIEAYLELGALVLRTDLQGTIFVSTDGERISIRGTLRGRE